MLRRLLHKSLRACRPCVKDMVNVSCPVLGTAIVDVFDDAEAAKLASLSEYLETLDADGCVICPG